MSNPAITILEGNGPRVDSPAFSDAEFHRRLAGVRSAMAEQGLDAFVSFTPENIYYLTAHDSPGYYFYQAMVVTHQRPPVNVLRQIETTNTLGNGWAGLAVAVQDREDPVQATLGLLAELGVAGKRIGAEANAWFVTPQRYAQLQRGVEEDGGALVDASMLVEQMRMTKSVEELAYIRRAARAVSGAMKVAFGVSREGASENEVAAATVAELIRSGSEYAGLPPFIVSGPRTSLCHATWSGRRYEKGDVLSYELPAVVRRYAAALYRTGTVGSPRPEFERTAAIVIEAHDAVMDAIGPGVLPREVHEASRRVFAKHGLPQYPQHRTGYSIGINYPPDWGEGQIISLWDGEERPLQPGMVFHCVPGVYELGRWNIIVSDTVLVTETGHEILTNCRKEPFVV